MNELTKDQWEKSMSTGFGNGDHPINHNNPHHDKLVVKLENAEMSMSDVTKLIKYSEALQKMFGNDVYQMAYVHDELQYAVPIEHADAVGNILKLAAIDAGKELNLNIQVDADYTVGNTWSDTH